MSTDSRATPPTDPGLPDVDVVIATKDRPELVRLAVAAVRRQTYRGRVSTVVVHDGGVPDRTLVETDPARTVRVVANRRTPGLAGARNTGVLEGHRPLVAFCDDDDTWAPDKLERQVRLLMTDPRPTCVTGIVVGYRDRRVVRVPDEDQLTVARLARTRVMAAHPSSVVVRRAALLGAIGLVDEDIPGSYGEDYDWILRAAANGGVSVVPLPLVDVRWGGSQFSREWRTIVAALDYLTAKHPAFGEDRHAAARLSGQRAFALAATGDHGALPELLHTLRLNPGEPRGYLAAAVACRAVSAGRVLDLLNRRGRGI